MSEIKTYATHFCGTGGACYGLEKAGLECKLAIDYKQFIVDAREKNLGHKALCMDISEYMPVPEHAADLLWTSPPCFIAGTMILCLDGYKPIEQVVVGDVVLTHKGRWRKVTSTMTREDARVIRIRAQGVPGIVCTTEHPFYVRRMHYKNDKRQFDDPRFLEAGKIEEGDFLAQVLPASKDADRHSLAFWYMIGRYLAEGWTSERDKHVMICGNFNEKRELAKLISAAGYAAKWSRERTTVRFTISSEGLYEFVQQFGKYAYGKRLPGFVYSLSESKAKSLLDGYFSGDGCRYSEGYSTANSVSKALALGIALLCQKGYGRVASCYFCPRPKKCVIEGRTVNQRPYWRVSAHDINRSGFISGKYGWKRCRGHRPSGKATVYNISVDEDESYVAEGAVVHNCQTFSTSARQSHTAAFTAAKNGDSSLLEALKKDRRHNLFLCSADYAEHFRPSFFVLENVVGLLTHDDMSGEGTGTFTKMMQTLNRLGYYVEWNVLDSYNFGVPQHRDRVFIIGSRDGQKGLFPQGVKYLKPPTFGDIMEHTTEGSWKETYKTAVEKVKRTDVEITVVEPGDVLPTITCGWGGGGTRKKVAILDWTPEGLHFLRQPTVREGARAQGFPEEWVFPDNTTQAWTLIGNAVASPVAESIGRHLLALSRGERPPFEERLWSNRIPEVLRRRRYDLPPPDMFGNVE